MADKTNYPHKFNIGSELDNQIYPEGDPSWGLKKGFLDVEDVKNFIKVIEEDLRRLGVKGDGVDFKLIGVEESENDG